MTVDVFHLLVHSWNGCKGWSCTGPTPGARSCCWGSSLGGRGPSTWSHLLPFLPGCEQGAVQKHSSHDSNRCSCGMHCERSFQPQSHSATPTMTIWRTLDSYSAKCLYIWVSWLFLSLYSGCMFWVIYYHARCFFFPHLKALLLDNTNCDHLVKTLPVSQFCYGLFFILKFTTLC